MMHQIFKVGDLVQRAHMFITNYQEFEKEPNLVFVVKRVIGEYSINIEPHNSDRTDFHNKAYDTERFIAVSSDQLNAKGIDLKSWSHSEIMELEVLIEEEWARRSAGKAN